MSAILDIPEVRQRVSPLSVEEYHRLDEYNENGKRTELIRGIIIEKMSKSPLHRTTGSLLYDLIAARHFDHANLTRRQGEHRDAQFRRLDIAWVLADARIRGQRVIARDAGDAGD